MTTHRTSVSIASPSALKKPTSVARLAAGLRTIASASKIVNKSNGTIAPFAAAAIGLLGINDASHVAKVCVCPPDVTARAASAAPAGSGGGAPACGGNNAKTDGASGMITTAVPSSSSTNTK